MGKYYNPRIVDKVTRCHGCNQLILATSYQEHALFCEPLLKRLGKRLNHNQYTNLP